MKKFLSLIIALVFIFSLSGLASAELNYRWIDVQDIVHQSFGSSGKFYPIEEVNATIWLPDEFTSIDPAEAGIGDGCIGFYVLGGNDYVLINNTDSDGLDLEGYYNEALQKGNVVARILVNDIPAIEQDNSSENSFLLMFQTQDNKFLQFIFSPLSNPVYGLIMSSIQSTVTDDPAPVVEPESVEVPATPAPVNPVSGLISK